MCQSTMPLAKEQKLNTKSVCLVFLAKQMHIWEFLGNVWDYLLLCHINEVLVDRITDPLHQGASYIQGDLSIRIFCCLQVR